MIRPALVCSLLAMAVAVTVSAEEFPLSFRTIPAKDVMSFPGGYGTYAQARAAKPAGVKREPKAVSKNPLYGEWSLTGDKGGFLFRLDEPKGDGSGYDQLIVDVNRNGDLTDDPAILGVVQPLERKGLPPTVRQMLFGPIVAAAGTTCAGGRPSYYAQGYLPDGSLFRGAEQTRKAYAGGLRFKASWYADATVEFSGLKQKVGVYDGDSNLRLGDISKPQTSGSSGQKESWYFRSADCLLVDRDGSGVFESDSFDSESCPYGPLAYLGTTPCKLTLARDGGSLRVEPWAGALAEVALQPHGEQVRSVTLAREHVANQWQLLRAEVAGGRIKVPPGSYRLYGCEVLGKAAPSDQVMVAAYQRYLQRPSSFAVGRVNTLRCGGPLELKVTAEKRVPESWELQSKSLREQPVRASDSEYVLAVNARVEGAGGEVYSTYAKGEQWKGEPPQPTLTVKDAGGRKVGSGKLEFG